MVTDAEIDYAETVTETAGCPDLNCDEITVCTACDRHVCAEHTHGVASCIEIGIHHLDCLDDCEYCTRQAAEDNAADLAIGYAQEGRR